MNKQMSAFDKLKEIEKELDSLKSFKKEHVEHKPIIHEEHKKTEHKPEKDKNVLILENINRTCIYMEKIVVDISVNLKSMLNIFKAAIKGESIEDVEKETPKEDNGKIDKLIEQNHQLLMKLESLTQDIKAKKEYSNFNMPPNERFEYKGDKI